MKHTKIVLIAMAAALAIAGPAFATGKGNPQTPQTGGPSNTYNNPVANGGTGVGVGVGIGQGGNGGNASTGPITNTNTATGGQGGQGGRGGDGGSVIGSGNSNNTNLNNNTQGQNQGQVQGQQQTAIAGASSSSSSSSNSSSGATSNSGGNTMTGGAHTSTQANSVTVNGDTVTYQAQERNPVNTAYAAPLTATNGTCMGSTSGGAQGAAFGISFGGTWTDTNCDIRYDAEALRAAGLPQAARARLCQKAEIAKAMEAAGTPCPGAKVAAAPAAAERSAWVPAGTVQAQYTDPIIRARLGLPPLK